MDFIDLGSIIIAFFITVVLIGTHAICPILLRYPFFNRPFISSLAGGSAATYVFLHMLPSLVENSEPFGKLLNQYDKLTPLLDVAIFIVALIGFIIYYGLSYWAKQEASLVGEENKKMYFLHLFMFGVYNFLISYTMPLRVQTGLFFSILFMVAIGVHFILIDRRFSRHFKQLFDLTGRGILWGALLLGWLLTALTDPINVLLVSLMVAFLSGSMLYVVFHEELGQQDESNFWGFLSGIVLFSSLLLGQALIP